MWPPWHILHFSATTKMIITSQCRHRNYNARFAIEQCYRAPTEMKCLLFSSIEEFTCHHQCMHDGPLFSPLISYGGN